VAGKQHFLCFSSPQRLQNAKHESRAIPGEWAAHAKFSPETDFSGSEGVLDKLQKVMKADVGSLVKDASQGASKVLKADVGKLLNADVGKLLNTDVADIFNAEDKDGAGPITKIAGTMPTKTADVPKMDTTGPSTVPGTAPGAGAAPPTRLTEELAVRHEYEKPYGQEIATLLPVIVGDFSRPPNEPTGKLATDPARANYAGHGAKLEVEVGSYWDEDEALERVRALQDKCASSKPSPDNTWMVGKSSNGITFAWMRESYVFAVTTQDAAALIRFLSAFPY
jgi:hypothetical protein